MINTLQQILTKKGEEYLNEFLSDELVITEKLDNYRFIFEQTSNNLEFYTKDNKKIDKVSRTLSDIYEQPINDISTIIKEYTLSIPNNYKFGVAYTPKDLTLRIPYKNVPKYILTDITYKDKNDTVSLSINEVEDWSSKLCLAKPPLIFKGKLSESQKETLINYSKRNFDNIKENNFQEIIKSLFGNTYSKQELIEGIVISSKDKLAQIISYEFDLLNEAYQKTSSNRDYYDITIMKLISFLDNYTLPILESKNKDQAYINIISDIFNKFVKENNLIETIDEQFLEPPKLGYSGNINTLFIENKETLEFINKSKLYENLFKIILSSLRKNKKPFGLLTESTVDKFNTFVYLINNCINKDEETEIIHLNEVNSENVVVQDIKQRQYTDMDNMRIISSIQKAFEPKIFNVTKGMERCVIYFTSFCPFTKAQYENVLSIYDKFKVPIILGCLSNKRKLKGDNFFFSDDLIKAQMKALGQYRNDLIKAFILLDNYNLYDVFEYTRPQFEPISLITDLGKSADFVLQLYYNEEVMGGKINIEKEFNIGEMNNNDSLVSFRSIEDNNMSGFKETSIEPIYSFFDTMRSEYLSWTNLK